MDCDATVARTASAGSQPQRAVENRRGDAVEDVERNADERPDQRDDGLKKQIRKKHVHLLIEA